MKSSPPRSLLLVLDVLSNLSGFHAMTGCDVTQSLRQYAPPPTHTQDSFQYTLIEHIISLVLDNYSIHANCNQEDTIVWTKAEETNQLKCMDQTSLKITFDLITCGCKTLCGTSSCMCAIDGFICIPAHKDNLMEKQINGCYTRMLRIVWMETIIPQYGSLPTQNPTKKDENGLSLDKAQRRNC